jgi:hypothetical protein
MRTLQKHRQQRKRKQTHPLPTRSLSSKLLTSLVSRQMVQNLELSLQWGLAQGAVLGSRDWPWVNQHPHRLPLHSLGRPLLKVHSHLMLSQC